MAGKHTRAVHAGRAIDPQTGAVSPPIHLSTTYARDEHGELVGDYLYGRHDNPNRTALEACLADLEGAQAAMAFGSGCAVAHAIAASLGSGDRLVISDDMYFGIRAMLRTLSGRGHFTLREVDMRDLDAVAAACADTASANSASANSASANTAGAGAEGLLVAMCESPTNPMMHVIDIEALAASVRSAGGVLVADNTMATPILQQPLALGADYVMHSTTKFIGGHSDVIGGALLCLDRDTELWRRIEAVRQVGGAVPSPFDCWLLLRSIATLPLRVERQADTAAQLAKLLVAHEAIEEVLYPGLASHPDHAVATRQMQSGGAMMSLLVRGGEQGAARFVGALNLITVATSLGGVHTLAEHRARVEGPGTKTPANLVRLSVGIEDHADLAADVANALSKVLSSTS